MKFLENAVNSLRNTLRWLKPAATKVASFVKTGFAHGAYFAGWLFLVLAVALFGITLGWKIALYLGLVVFVAICKGFELGATAKKVPSVTVVETTTIKK